MFGAIARFSVRWRWFIIIFWIALIPIVSHSFPSINSVTKDNNSDFLPKNTPTGTATKLENEFNKNAQTSTLLVASRSNGDLTAADQAAVTQVTKKIMHVKDVVTVQNQGASADGQAEQILVALDDKAFGQDAITIVKNIRDQIKSAKLPSGLQLNLTGDLAASVDADNSNKTGRDNTQNYTIILIIVLLLVVFRALLAPLVTLVPAALTLAVAQPVIAESTKIGVQVGFLTQILLIVLILGAGADYGLFLVFRVREELRKGAVPKEAVVLALTRVGESITFSALTVASALLSLLLATFGIYKGLGPALAIGLGIMLLASLTFLPALLAILGRAVFWPSKTHKQAIKIGLWGRLADNVIKKPVLMLVLGVLVFGSLSLGILGYKAGGFGNQSAPTGSDSAAGQQVLEKHFPAANNSPQLLIFHFPSSVWDNLASVEQIQPKLQASGLYKAVSGPFSANGFKLSAAQLGQLHSQDPSNPILLGEQQFISNNGRIVQFYGVLKAGAAGTSPAMSVTPQVRSNLSKIAPTVGADQATDFSADSVAYDVNKVANHDLTHIIPVVLLVIAALLALLLRSLVAPWYLILTVGLSYMASLGFAMLVFVHWLHHDGLFFILPFLMFIFCMALGEDYNILVMSRIREEAHNEPNMKAAVTKAIGITGTTVTSAGLILAGTFTVLGIVGGNAQVEQIGFGIAFGILLDTFFVRTLLVPSIVALLGQKNWWPSHLSRR